LIKLFRVPCINKIRISAHTKPKIDQTTAPAKGQRSNILLDKYFHESSFSSHYDNRFGIRPLSKEEKRSILVNLLDVFSGLCTQMCVTPILMHGALIGWCWNRRLLPWDSDIDLCIPFAHLYILHKMHRHMDYDRTRYLFDVNPHYTSRASANIHFHQNHEPNKIDARFIDKNSGLFLDITALSPKGGRQLTTKCPHVYRKSDLYPLKKSSFEQVPVWIPNDVHTILAQEYGDTSFSSPTYKGLYRFDTEKNEWIHI
jgi:LicD family